MTGGLNPEHSGEKWFVTFMEKSLFQEIVATWLLDMPVTGWGFQPGQPTRIQGWALAAKDAQAHLHLVVRTGVSTYSYRLNQERSDVIKAVLKDPDQQEASLLCGFSYEFPAEEVRGGVDLGFERDGRIFIAAQLRPA